MYVFVCVRVTRIQCASATSECTVCVCVCVCANYRTTSRRHAEWLTRRITVPDESAFRFPDDSREASAKQELHESTERNPVHLGPQSVKKYEYYPINAVRQQQQPLSLSLSHKSKQALSRGA